MSTKIKNDMLENQVCSYLEFGSLNRKTDEREVYDFRLNDKAYDWLMHARYSHDIFAYKVMSSALANDAISEVVSTFENEVHHNNDFMFNLNKKLALDLSGKSFFELGQTLFGCIDTIEFINQVEQYLALPNSSIATLQSVNWLGVDISPFFNLMAEKMHGEYKVVTSTSVDTLPESYDVFFAKGITLLYAINSAQALFNLVSKAKITVFDYSISLTEQEDSFIGTGKSVRFLGKVEFERFYQMIRKSGRDIWVRGNSKADPETNKFYIEGIIANKAISTAYIEKQNTWVLSLKQQSPELYSALIHNKSDEYMSWSKLSDII